MEKKQTYQYLRYMRDGTTRKITAVVRTKKKASVEDSIAGLAGRVQSIVNQVVDTRMKQKSTNR